MLRFLIKLYKRCKNAEIYNFMLIEKQAPACRFYKTYDFSLTSRFFNKPLRNLLGDFLNLGVLFLTMWIDSC